MITLCCYVVIVDYALDRALDEWKSIFRIRHGDVNRLSETCAPAVAHMAACARNASSLSPGERAEVAAVLRGVTMAFEAFSEDWELAQDLVCILEKSVKRITVTFPRS